MERGFKGVFIPAEIWLNTELTASEKMLFAEIDSLDNEEGCYATNEYLADFCGVSIPTITRGIAKLKSLGYIEQVSFTGRTRVLRVIKMIRQTNQIDESPSSKCENLLLIENKKENNIKSTGAGASSKNHSQVYKKREILNDDLESGEIIDEHIRERKKKSEYDKCLAEIKKRYFNSPVQLSLQDHLEWSYNSKDPKRIRTLAIYKRRLDELDKLDGDKIAIVQQSINRQWHCFYELQESKSKLSNKREELSDVIKVTTQEEVQNNIAILRESGKELF